MQRNTMKNLYTVFFLLFACFRITAQSCPPMTDCSNAPLFCGFSLQNQVFNNAVPILPGAFDPLCGPNFTTHNSNWFRIVPCSPNLMLTINVLNTSNGDGLQAALYTGCESAATVACNPGQEFGAFIPLVLSAIVTPGQEYYLQIDGFSADICTYTITVDSGIDVAQPPPPVSPFPGQITASPASPSNICTIGGPVDFTADWPGCSTFESPQLSCYEPEEDSCKGIKWRFPPNTIIIGDPYANPVKVDFSNVTPGMDTVWAKPMECGCPENLCPDCGQVCCPVEELFLVITINGPSVINLPVIEVCQSAWPPGCAVPPNGSVTGNTAVCNFPNPSACQLIRQPYQLRQPVITALGTVMICENESVQVCDSTFTTPGTFTSICSCDSVVTVTVVKDLACFHDCVSYNFPAPPGDNCGDAPFFCGNYLDNYCSSNMGLDTDTIQGVALSNAGFLRVSPCQDSINLAIAVGNCQQNAGLFFWLVTGDCNAPQLSAPTVVANNNTGNLIAYNLIPDSTYFIVFSGISGDVCEFNVSVVEGIGTAVPGPTTCDCTDGAITGPAEVCPADLVTYTITPPQCTITSTPGTGGNGYYCCPETPGSQDSLHLVWHIPSFMSFIGDSVDVLTITVQIDSALLGIDTTTTDTVWVSYGPLQNTPPDTLTFCDCAAPACAVDISFLPVTISHQVETFFCQLTCASPSCLVDGVVYTAPVFFMEQTNCVTKTVTIVSDFEPPAVFIFPPSSITCINPTVTVVADVNPPFSFIEWSGPSVFGQFGPVITVDQPGFYTCIATNPVNGCTAIAGTAVTMDIAIPNVSVNGNTSICVGEQAVLSAFSDVSFAIFNWSTGENGPAITVAPMQTTTYGVTVTNPVNGCTNTALVTVTVNPPQIVEMGEVGQITCAEPCFTFMGNSYCAPGSYEVIQNACTIIHFSVGANLAPVPNVLPPVAICNGACYTFFGQSYCSSTTATFEENCILYVQEIQVAPELLVAGSPEITICLGETAQIAANASGGTGPYFYQWNTGENTPEVTVSPIETTTYTVTVTDAAGCSQTAQVTVVVTTLQVVQAGIVGRVSCSQPCFSFMGNTYCSPGQYNAVVNCLQTNFEIAFAKDTVTVGTAGTITCAQSCVTFQNQNYCQAGSYTATDSCTVYIFEVAVNTAPPVCSAPMLDCLPGNNNYTVGFSISGAQPYKVNGTPIIGNYYLSEPVPSGQQYNFIVEQTTNGCQTLLNGSYDCSTMCTGETATLSATVLNSCTNTAVTAVVLNPALAAPGQSALYYLHTSPGNTIGTVLNKNTSGVFAFDPALMQDEVTYFISSVVGITNAAGDIDWSDACTKVSEGQPVVFHALPQFQEIAMSPPNCPGISDGAIIVMANGADPVEFSINAGAWSTNNTFEDLADGIYAIAIRDANICFSDSTVVLLAADTVWITLGPDRTVTKGESTTLVPQTNALSPQFDWSGDPVTSSHTGATWLVTPEETTRYTCTVTDGKGCTAVASLRVQVRPDGLYVPNVITPETGDPANQRFTLFAQEGYVTEINSLEIFDRWGSSVFTRKNFLPNDPSLGWDGTFNNKYLRPDVFTFVALVRLYDGSTKTVKGDVTVVR